MEQGEPDHSATHSGGPLAPGQQDRQQASSFSQRSRQPQLRGVEAARGFPSVACHLAATPPSPVLTIRVAEDSGRSHISALALYFQTGFKFSRPVENRLRISSPDTPPGSWL